MKHIILILMTAATITSCGHQRFAQAIDNQNQYLASFIKVNTDTTLVYLTDYFPTIGAIDSISASPGYSIIREQRDYITFRLVAAPNAPRVGYLTFRKGSQTIDAMVVRISEPNVMITTSGTDSESGAVEFESNRMGLSVVAMWQNRLLPASYIKMKDDDFEVSIPQEAKGIERSFLRVVAYDDSGLSNDVLVPLSNGRAVKSALQLTRADQQSQVIYSLMIDRFENGNPQNDWKIDSKDVLPVVDYMGGDVKGITQKIENGFFKDLGVSTIWISPVTQNPYTAWGQNENPRTKFSGYHGYWPIYITELDRRFATHDEFEELIEVAHKNGINIILDYVANHMHQESPTLRAHPDWTTPAKTPDGRDNIALWDEYRLTTWFDKHIPTLDLERAEVYEPMTDSALLWLERYDLDGFRHDASKHIPEVYWRTLTRKMREHFPDRALYQIGETYGSPELIGSYVRSGMLDAQFDFNLYDAAVWALVDTSGSMENVMRTMNTSLATYGYHNTMGYITGNHDRGRFISYAGEAMSLHEDAKKAGWERTITVGDSALAYARLKLLEALIFTIPGVPTVYQGDDYGAPGGNDPDNRHMMKFTGHNPMELSVTDNLSSLAKIRRGSMPLMYGDFEPLYADKYMLCFARSYMGRTVVVAINNHPTAVRTIDVSPTFDSKDLHLELAPLTYQIIEL